nr:hypothetical protein [Tanacetum cinerariifolium]
MNTSQDIKIQMVDDNVGNQVRHNAVQNDGNEVGQNKVQNLGIQIVRNMNGLSVVLEIANQHRNGNVVTASAEGNDATYLQQHLQIAQEEVAGIQNTQEEFEFMAAADAYEETERVKVNCTLEDTLQQASTSGTQSNNALVYDPDRSTELPKDENCYDHDIFNMLTHEVQYTDLQTELDRKKEKLEIALLKRKKNTLFFGIIVDKTNSLSKPVTSNSAPSTRESKVMQTVNVIAPRIFRTNPSKISRIDNVVPNKLVKTSVKIKPITISQPNVIHKQQANSDSNVFSSTRVNNTAKTRRPHLRSNSNTDRVPSKSKSSFLSNNIKKIEESHRNS